MGKHRLQSQQQTDGCLGRIDGASLTQWPYWGGANEIFQVSSAATSWRTLLEGYVTLQPVHSGLCLTVAVLNDGWTEAFIRPALP